MHQTGTLYKMDGSQETVTPSVGKKFSLEELQKYVGGFIELIPAYTRIPGIVYANEDGLLLRLPFNEVASRLVGRSLVGDVLVVVSRR